MSKPNPSTALAALLNALADHTERVTDADILADTPKAGGDPKAEAIAVRSVLLGAVKTFRKERRQRAAEQHEQAVRRLDAHAARLPNTAVDRRALLGRVVAKRPQVSEGMTLQFRDFTSLSDADVESALNQLDALGMLDEESDPEKDT